MDFWRRDYEDRDTTSVLAGMQEFVESPINSNNSFEYSSDSIVSDQVDAPRSVLTSKASLAKKKLQDYCANKQKQDSLQEGCSVEKPHKQSFNRAKKTYPDDAAKAVIRDIETLKRTGYGYSGPLPRDILLPADPIVPNISLLQLPDDFAAVSVVSDLEEENNLFKKREIRCKNIRKSDDIYQRRSISPKRRNSKSETYRKDKKEYPENWAEYKEMGMNPQKVSLLKLKQSRSSRNRRFEFKRYFDFEAPPVQSEDYKYLYRNGEPAWVPFPYLRCTATKPQILYSTNQHVNSPGYLTRKQLFTLIPKERRLVIEKLGKLSRCEVDDSKAPSARKWYPRNWKKIDNSAEAKLLENSVGLSFLQGYSDEEEEEPVQDNNQKTITDVINKHNDIDKIKYKKDIEFIEKTQAKLAAEKEQLTPPGTPKTTPVSLAENLEKEDLKDATKTKTSRKERDSDRKKQDDNSNYSKTPPLEDREEGEVESEEDHKNSREYLDKIRIDEYEKTKEELEELEAVFKSSTEYFENDVFIKEVEKKEIKRPDKKKHRKVTNHKIKNKKSRKRSKKKLEKKEKDHSPINLDSPEPHEEVRKKRKPKKKRTDSKTKPDSDRKHKARKKKLKKTVEVIKESGKDLAEESNLEITLPKKKKKRKKRLETKSRKPTISGSSQGQVSDRKSSADIVQEEYEDDIRFFAARFDAESKLRGKTRHKTKANISLEELTVHPKTEEKPHKRKSKGESNESDALFSPESLRKKEQKNKDESAKKNNDKEVSSDDGAKKSKIKVDLLKMNEEYLKEQKRKEERDSSTVKDDGICLHKKEDTPESILVSKRDRSLSIEKADSSLKDFIYSTKELGEESAQIIEIDKSDEEITKLPIPTEPEAKTIPGRNQQNSIPIDTHLDLEQNRKHRKRRSSTKVSGKAHRKKLKHNLTSHPVADIIEVETSEPISLPKIKKEIDVPAAETYQFENELNNSWESDEEVIEHQVDKNKSMDLEIPLNFQFLSRREVKIEQSIVNTDKNKVEEIIQEKRLESTLQQLPLKVVETRTQRVDDPDLFYLDIETPPKKGRWDIKSPVTTPLMKVEKSDEIIDVDANSSSNCVTLENEYEEFMKALTATKEEICNPQPIKPIADNNTGFSFAFLGVKNDTTLLKTASDIAVRNIEELLPKPILDIPTIQIPLPPSVPEPIKPVPVPSPKLEAVIDLNKPLINLSLSANVTQNITLSLATSVPSISAPITSSIDIAKTSVEISAPDTLVSMTNVPLPFTQMSSSPTVNVPDITLSQISVPFHMETRESNMAAAPTGGESGNMKLGFTSLTLPSKKKLLVDSSKLKLDDSDNDDQAILEELKRKKLEALIADNEREALTEQQIKLPEIPMERVEIDAKTKSPSSKPSTEARLAIANPPRISDRHVEASPRLSKKEQSPHLRRDKDSPVRRRESSPRRQPSKRKSPRRSPKRRSPVRRRKSPVGRRSTSPRRRRGSISPRRRRSPSPRRKRSTSPRGRQSPLRHNRTPSPRSKRSNVSKESRSDSQRSGGRPRSPIPINQRDTSPLKRSVADSTISDDQLLQTDYYGDPKQIEKDSEYHSPKRVPLDVRISQVLGYDEHIDISPRPISSNDFYHQEAIQQHPHYQFDEQYRSIQSQVTHPAMRSMRVPQSTYKQVGNMLQIVPTDSPTEFPMSHHVSQIEMPSHSMMDVFHSSVEHNPSPAKPMEIRQKILQVGNMLQIVPNEMVPTELIPIPRTEIKIEKTEEPWLETSVPSEKPSAEASMLLKVAERRAERESRRQEREKRRKEKEKRRKEKEKERQAKLKVRTENMIKRALELEEEEEGLESDSLIEHPVQWPPTSIVVSHSVFKEAGKSILINSSAKQLDESLPEERKGKIVQFADGVRPGEGTSPSAGEDLTSPPPPKKKLPKEKRYKKIQFDKKSNKKKVKVRIIKKPPSPMDDSESDENLPPPSPPPGSPPPHVFPPRIKVNAVNNVPAAYLASIIQTAQQQQQPQQGQQPQYPSNLYRTPISLIMAPPPPPQGHLSSVPGHIQSPHGATGLSPQTHYHPGLAAPPPPPLPPLPQPHSTGHSRHYTSR